MPSQADLAKIASGIYKGNPSISTSGTTSGLTYDENNTTGFPEPDFKMWIEEDHSYRGHYAYIREFGTTSWSLGLSYRNNSSVLAVCLTD